MKKVVLFLSVLFLIFSCSDDNEQTENQTLQYFPMAIGNYWVYEEVMIDANSTETHLPRLDSVFISKDTLIGKCKYYFVGTSLKDYPSVIAPGYYRDSLGYLVDRHGVIWFSQTNFNDVLLNHVELNQSDTIYTVTCKMEEVKKPVTVPAGTFEVLNYSRHVVLHPEYASSWSQRTLNNYFSKNVGIITNENSYSRTSQLYQKRLIRFKVVN